MVFVLLMCILNGKHKTEITRTVNQPMFCIILTIFLLHDTSVCNNQLFITVPKYNFYTITS